MSRLRKHFWPDNMKRHDIPTVMASIRENGYRDPVGYDRTLNAIVEGNGRVEALVTMYDEDRDDPPDGVVWTPRTWKIPVIVGMDAKTVQDAIRYAIDHNNTTVMHAGADAADVLKLWDLREYAAVLKQLDEKPVTFGEDDDALLQQLLTEPEGDDWAAALAKTAKGQSAYSQITFTCTAEELAQVKAALAVCRPPAGHKGNRNAWSIAAICTAFLEAQRDEEAA